MPNAMDSQFSDPQIIANFSIGTILLTLLFNSMGKNALYHTIGVMILLSSTDLDVMKLVILVKLDKLTMVSVLLAKLASYSLQLLLTMDNQWDLAIVQLIHMSMVKLALQPMANVFHALMLHIKLKIVPFVIRILMQLVKLVVPLSFKHVVLDLH